MENKLFSPIGHITKSDPHYSASMKITLRTGLFTVKISEMARVNVKRNKLPLSKKKIDKKSVIVTVSVCRSSKNGTAKNRFLGFLAFLPSLIRGVTVTSKKLISGNLKAVYSYKCAGKLALYMQIRIIGLGALECIICL